MRRLTGDYRGRGPGPAGGAGHLPGPRAPGQAEAAALNESGTLSRIRGDLGQARACHQQALDLARQIGTRWRRRTRWPAWAACALAAGHTATAEDLLRQALAIFQRIGAAETAGLTAELDALPGTTIRPPPPPHDSGSCDSDGVRANHGNPVP